jgi:carbon-monoxide dehydrogenase medium subunit
MRPFDLLDPSTVEEATALLAEHGGDARLIAGGAMLMILLRERLMAPRALVSTLSIRGLSGIRAVDGGLHIGANTTLRDVERSAAVRLTFPVLAEATRLVGNVRVRTVATVGGHLAQADPHLDLPPVLAALGASVETVSPRGRRTLPLDSLLVAYYETCLEPDEMIVSLQLPSPPPGLHGVYLKYCSLSPNDWPTLGVVALLRAENGRFAEARVVVGGVSERPLRLADAEALLVGSEASEVVFSEVGRRYADSADPIPDVRGSVEYKRQVTAVYVRRALAAAAARASM